MNPTSAARPTDLEAYARSGDPAVARLTAAGHRLEAALGAFHARCVEYRVPQTGGLAEHIFVYGRREGELAARVREIARGFRQADSGPRPVVIGPLLPRPTPRQVAEDGAERRWNRNARSLIQISRLARPLVWLYGRRLPAMLPGLSAALASAVLVCGVDTVDLIVDGNASRLAGQPVVNYENLFNLLLQGFWYESMDHVDPELFLELTTEIDALNLILANQRGTAAGEPRTADQAEGLVDPLTGALDVSVQQAFQSITDIPVGAAAPFAPSVADSMGGDHSGISYFPGEQVRLERLNADTGDYRISIAGLDPSKPAAPNNFSAVALTSQGVTEGNPYFAHVKERFLSDLERIPAGSTLHLEGHSMGGGMCFLLRDDPEVQQALVAAGVTVGSLITVGAVRPRGAARKPGDDARDPFASAEERHYVNTDDSLALNVGAGHASDPAVILLEDGKVDDPLVAHGDYGNPQNYSGLPPELQTMPYVVDPATYVALSTALPALQELPTPAPAPTPTAATPVPDPLLAGATSVAGPAPAPSPTPTAVPAP